MATSRVRILFVDDEPHVLAAMRRVVCDSYEVSTAIGGEEGLACLRSGEPFAAIVSDLRMPVIDGISLLRTAAEIAPSTVRILLTGNGDIEHAILAINDGGIFRFLTKPCPSSRLRQTVAAAVQQHELITAEQVLLERTLRGSIRAMAEIVALVHPAVGAKASRVRRVVVEMAESLGVTDIWRIEVAALLANMGSVTLPPATVEKIHLGRELLTHEQRLCNQAPVVAAQLITNIPRMEEVHRALLCQNARWDGKDAAPSTPRGEAIPLAARLIRIATDLDTLESRGMTRDRAVAVLETRAGYYDPAALAVLARPGRIPDRPRELRDVTLAALEPGMVVSEDLQGSDGVLLVARGTEITPTLIAHIREYGEESMLLQTVRAWPPAGGEAGEQQAA